MLNKPMNTMRAAMLILAACAVTAVWAQSVLTLQYKGDVVSKGVRMVDGVPYVPLSDVAHILGGTAAKTAGGYQIAMPAAPAAAGGANQVNGLAGKIGDTLFTGKWRFQVTGVTRAPQFQTQYEPTTETVAAQGGNDEVVNVACYVKNGVAQPRQLGLRTGSTYDTALTDDQGQSYPPIHFDFAGGSGYGPTMLPGAAVHFNVYFEVPKGTNLKDLVFSLWSYEDTKVANVRVSLAQ